MSTNQLHVVFGTGPLGLAVIDELVRQNKPVRAVNRSGKASVPAGVEMMAGDAGDPAFTRQAAQGAGVVYNCVNPPYTQWPELFPRLQAGVLAGAASNGAKLVVMENLYMYGPTGGKMLTENLPYASTTRKGRTRATMSQALLEAHQRGEVRVTMGRASDYFGPRGRESAMGERVMYPALAGKTTQFIGKVDLLHSYTYIPDVGKALVILGERDEALGKAWHIPNAPAITTREFIGKVYAEAGHTPRISMMPKLLLKGLALVVPILRELDEMAYEFEEPFLVDSSPFERTFGMTATPLDSAIRTTVEWFREHPKNGPAPVPARAS